MIELPTVLPSVADTSSDHGSLNKRPLSKLEQVGENLSPVGPLPQTHTAWSGAASPLYNQLLDGTQMRIGGDSADVILNRWLQ